MTSCIFRCHCNDELPYGAKVCSYCFQPTPIWNRRWVPVCLSLLAVIAFWLYPFHGEPRVGLKIEPTVQESWLRD